MFLKIDKWHTSILRRCITVRILHRLEVVGKKRWFKIISNYCNCWVFILKFITVVIVWPNLETKKFNSKANKKNKTEKVYADSIKWFVRFWSYKHVVIQKNDFSVHIQQMYKVHPWFCKTSYHIWNPTHFEGKIEVCRKAESFVDDTITFKSWFMQQLCHLFDFVCMWLFF